MMKTEEGFPTNLDQFVVRNNEQSASVGVGIGKQWKTKRRDVTRRKTRGGWIKREYNVAIER